MVRNVIKKKGKKKRTEYGTHPVRKIQKQKVARFVCMCSCGEEGEER